MTTKHIIFGLFFSLSVLLILPYSLNGKTLGASNSAHFNLRPGTITGIIERTESDSNGLFSLWMRVHRKMYEFIVGNAHVTGGKKSDLKKGVSVRITYKSVAHSEMDDFYVGDAQTITILKKQKKK